MEYEGRVKQKDKHEENKHGCDSDTRIHSGGQDIVVLCPPGEIAPAYDVLEDEPDDRPGYVVDSAGGRDVGSP